MSRYLFACVHSWAWHLCYGMWKGYRETRLSVGGEVIELSSTHGQDWKVVKVFYKHDEPQHSRPKEG